MSQKIISLLFIAFLMQGCSLEGLIENPDEALQEEQLLNDDTGAALEEEDLSNFTPSEALKSQLDPTPQPQVQLSGVVSVFAQPSSKLLLNDSSQARESLGSLSSLAGAVVKLKKKFSNGTIEEVASATTDANGAYSFSDVAAAVTGQGENSDFYYELAATLSDNSEIAAPAAPIADNGALNISPESNIAANIVGGVIKLPGTSKIPVPSFRSMRNLGLGVGQNMHALRDSISIPSASTVNADGIKAAANGIASTGGNAEIMYKAYQFNSEWVRLLKTTTSTENEYANYLKRIVREQCGQQDGKDPLPGLLANALAKAAKTGTTFTPSSIVDAINASNPQAALDAAYAVKRYAYVLDQIERNLVKSTTEAEDFTAKQIMALFSMRDLRSYNIAIDSALNVDQAVTFLQYVGNTGGSNNTAPPPPGDTPPPPPPAKMTERDSHPAGPAPTLKLCEMPSDMLINAIASLLNDTSLTQPAIADAQIFHDSGFGCDQNAGKGHFRAEINIFPGNTSVTGVTITSSDSTALDGDGSVEVTDQFNGNYRYNTENSCVTLGTAATYTVTASFADGSSASETYDRTHPLVHETQAKYGTVDMSKDHNTATKVAEKRPTISWEAPASMLARITNAPTGSQVKYSYEFSYIDTSASQIGPVSQCDSISSSGALYAVDSFMPTVDCDPAACATSSGIAQSNLQCRVYVNTYLVDGADRILGQSAGNFTYYCVDINQDGMCDG